MEQEQFFKIVMRMRIAQKAYSRTGTKQYKTEKESLEKEVDAEIARVEAEREQQEQAKQMTLFNDGYEGF